MKKAEVLKHIGQEATVWRGIRYRTPAYRVRIEEYGYKHGLGGRPYKGGVGVLCTNLNKATGDPVLVQYGDRIGEVSQSVYMLAQLDPTPWTEVQAERAAAAEKQRQVRQDNEDRAKAEKERLDAAQLRTGGRVEVVSYGRAYRLAFTADEADELVKRLA